MADKNIYNSKDSMDISELASLNDDISPELIEELQQKIEQDAQIMKNGSPSNNKPAFDVNDDSTLFEEPSDLPIEDDTKEEAEDNNVTAEKAQPPKKDINIEKNFDDNFIKKYKAKLDKQENSKNSEKNVAKDIISNVAFTQKVEPIDKISKGNITERKITKEQKEYNDSLDFLDDNIKYSKYVIYIDPQNVEFIESLTVKERKNLINRILREQDDIAITKHRFKVVNTIIKHGLIAIITIILAVPVIYWVFNSSLEVTINNYRHSQSLFQTLYKHNGKITKQK